MKPMNSIKFQGAWNSLFKCLIIFHKSEKFTDLHKQFILVYASSSLRQTESKSTSDQREFQEGKNLNVCTF